MRLQFLPVRAELRPFVDTAWLFQSPAGLPPMDSRVVAPNGRVKLIISLENPLLVEQIGGATAAYADQQLYVIGLWDKPVVLSSAARPTTTLGFELNPRGASRLLRAPLHELTNAIVTGPELYGAAAGSLQRQLAASADVPAQAAAVQQFLVQRLAPPDAATQLVAYAVARLEQSQGLLPIQQLEKQLGYSRRYVDQLFARHVGLSPKALAGILRFQAVYRQWAAAPADFLRSDLRELYYDQAHLTREFRRYTGRAPGQYGRQANSFGQLFYRGQG